MGGTWLWEGWALPSKEQWLLEIAPSAQTMGGHLGPNPLSTLTMVSHWGPYSRQTPDVDSTPKHCPLGGFGGTKLSFEKHHFYARFMSAWVFIL